jgi:hypothetical protein
LTFKDIKKKVGLEATVQQQTRIFERLRNKPFWIWDQQQPSITQICSLGKTAYPSDIVLKKEND